MISIKNRVDNLLGAWIVCQGDQDKNIILPNAKFEVNATLSRGKNMTVVGLPCIGDLYAYSHAISAQQKNQWQENQVPIFSVRGQVLCPLPHC
jgi:hypothetical protein